MSGPSLTAQLARRLAEPPPEALRRRTALHVLDWVGCAVLGAQSEPGRIVRELAASLGPGACRAIGAGWLDPASAAFVNGAYGNVLEMDDIHRAAILHPGPVVIPAALAAAEQLNASGPALLDAVARGYEAMIRIGRSVGPGHYRRWHNTSTCGPFGAAAAVGALLGLDQQAMVAALGLAGTQASGPWQTRIDGPMAKQLHNARAAQAGWTAAMLAARGFTGPARILEGEFGFYAAMCPDPDPAQVVAPSDGWLIEETSFKPWPACRHAHAAIDAALALRPQLDGAAVDAAEVRTYADAVAMCDNVEPTTTLEAKFSLQHSVAIALLDGAPQLAAFEGPALRRADVAALRRRIAVRAAEPFASAYPRRFGAGITLQLADGRVLRADAPDALGDPENPVSDDAIVGKARMLMGAAGLPADEVEALVAAALGLATGGSPSQLTARLP